MDDKIFNLLEKMYADLKQDINGVKQDVLGVKGEVSVLREEVAVVRKSQVHVETVLTPKAEAALDGYRQVYEKLLEHDLRFDTLEARLDTHDTQIGVLKKKNA